jgi:hypothetical protein
VTAHRRKVCRACGLEKGIKCFYRDAGCVDGYKNRCTECSLAASREHYELKREVINEQRAEKWANDPALRSEYRDRKRRWVQTPNGKQSCRESWKAYRVTRAHQQVASASAVPVSTAISA